MGNPCPVAVFLADPWQAVLLLSVAPLTVRTPPRSALSPAGNHVVELLLFGGGELPGPAVDALGVQPHAQGAFCLVVSFAVPGPVVACGEVGGDLC